MTTQPRQTAAQKRAAKKAAEQAQLEAQNAEAQAADVSADEADTTEEEDVDQESESTQATEAEKVEVESGVHAAPKTLADAQVAASVSTEMVTPAKTIAELTKGSDAFAKKEVDLGGGVTITARADHPAVNEGVRSETLERFLLTKYNLKESDYSEALRRTIRGFEQYHMNMNSRAPVSLDEAARHQANWYRIVAGALDSQLGDSSICFDVILYLAARHADDLFTDRLACRAFNALPDGIRDTFNLYQTIILNAANPRTRSHYIRTALNLDAVAKVIKSDNQRRNLLAYLSTAAQ